MEEIFAGNLARLQICSRESPLCRHLKRFAASLEGAQAARIRISMAAIHTALLAADVGAGDDIVAKP